MESGNNFNVKNYLNALNIIHLGMISGLIMFGLIAFILKQSQEELQLMHEDHILFVFVAAGYLFIEMALGNFMFKAKNKQAKLKSCLKDKLTDYRSAVIIRLALIESAALLSLVLFFLFGDTAFLVVTFLTVLLMLTIKPAPVAIIRDLELSHTERAAFNF